MDFDIAIKSEILKKQIDMLEEYINNKGLPYLYEYGKHWRIFEMILRRVTKNDSIEKEDIENLYNEFEEEINTIELTTEEKIYLAYNKYRRHFNESDKSAEWDILLRRKLIEIVGEGSVEEAIKALERDHFEYPSDIEFAINLIKMNGWENKDDLKKIIKDNVEGFFNMSMNCGGYALKVDTCIFGGSIKTIDPIEYLDRNVTSLLEKFPFIRLLGDTELREDEYIVEYRVNSEGGHHFIRIEPDGTIKDKNECNPPRILDDLSDEEKVWGNYLKDCPSAFFAVNMNHDIHAEKYSYSLGDGHNFEEIVLENIKLANNDFEYHNHYYTITDDGKGNQIVYSNNELVATIISDESGTIVVEEEEKRDYISNTKSSTFDRYKEQLRTVENQEKNCNNDEIEWEFEL